MNYFRKPNHLEPGDTVGIISPSSTISPFPRRLKRGIEALENLGLNVRLGNNCQKTYGKAAGTPQERADDINTFFKDGSVKAIICSTGGYNANSILPLLDYGLINNNPKIFCGYSDITLLNLAINTKARLVTFNGPTLLPTFGEFERPFPFTIKAFKKALFSTSPIGLLPSSKDISDESLWWDKEDDRPSNTRAVKPYHDVHGGQAEGILLGGNLETLTLLGGTEYLPDFQDCILFLEEMGESTDTVERNLTYLEHLGVFEKISGLLYGRPYQFEDDNSRTLHSIIKDFASRYNLPTIVDIDCGHTNPMLTLPLGVSARLDADSNTVAITESAVI